MKTLLKDLNWKFSFLGAFIILGVILAEQAILMKQARVAMESRLSEKAAFINTFYAFVIADALQRKDDVTLLQYINRLEEDPEILSVVVVDGKGEVRYHADSEKLGLKWEDATILKALETGDGFMSPFSNSGGRAQALVSPLKIQGNAKPIGVVRIEMTYRHVQNQLSKFESSFRLSVLGMISAGIGILMLFVKRWVITPLGTVEKTISGMHLATLEPNLTETPDEFGRLNKALNDLATRFRIELQEQLGTGATPSELEKDLIDRLLPSFLPKARFIIADKDNRIISHLIDGQPAQPSANHLLDLITDANFATLVGTAYQEEGRPVRGPVQFQDASYEAVVLCIPDNQSKVVKTVIALQKGEV